MSQLSSPFKSHDETGKRENGKTAATSHSIYRQLVVSLWGHDYRNAGFSVRILCAHAPSLKKRGNPLPFHPKALSLQMRRDEWCYTTIARQTFCFTLSLCYEQIHQSVY